MTKHVESKLVTCLDPGSTPGSSTSLNPIKLIFRALLDFVFLTVIYIVSLNKPFAFFFFSVLQPVKGVYICLCAGNYYVGMSALPEHNVVAFFKAHGYLALGVRTAGYSVYRGRHKK